MDSTRNEDTLPHGARGFQKGLGYNGRMSLYLGCPVWSYKGWVGDFFPMGTKASDFLREYARRLNTVEGNTTFYAVPAARTIERWVAETPETFRFCPKIPRRISHTGRLVEHRSAAAEFLSVMRGLGARLGPIFLQLPPRFGPGQIDDLRAFLTVWPADAELAVEVRHPDWFEVAQEEALDELLNEFGAARVVIDTRPIRDLRGDRILDGSVYQRLLEARVRKPDLPAHRVPPGPFVFLRYIGHPRLDHNTAVIEAWADQLVDWIRDGKPVYVFCHCPDETLDPWLCRRFHRAIRERTPVPPLPWDSADADIARQGRLL